MAQLKYWNGTAWVSASIGAQGIQGVQGNLGLQGTQGIQGGFSFGLGTGVQTFLSTPSSENLSAAVTNETGSGALVFATSPTIATPTMSRPVISAQGGSEGGEINLASPASGSTITNGVNIDIFNNLLRFFEGGGTSRGMSIDVTTLGATVGSTIATTDTTQTFTNKTLTTPTINTPLLTLSTTSSTTEGRIAWDSTNDKILVGGTLNGTAQAIQFASSTLTISTPTFTTNAYTVVLTDKDKWLELSNGATAGTLRIPTDASVAFPIGTQLNLLQTGAGQITIAATTPGTTTVNGTPGLNLRGQWSSATIIKRAANSWVVVGDLSD
jgi:hypothetical protein